MSLRHVRCAVTRTWGGSGDGLTSLINNKRKPSIALPVVIVVDAIVVKIRSTAAQLRRGRQITSPSIVICGYFLLDRFLIAFKTIIRLCGGGIPFQIIRP